MVVYKQSLNLVLVAEEYGGPPKPSIDLSKLPSAPRSSRGADIDMSRLPSRPPYTAFLGNLPFDVSEDDIRNLFQGLQVSVLEKFNKCSVRNIFKSSL